MRSNVRNAISDFEAQNKHKIPLMNLEQFAKQLNYSPAAIVKGLKQLGYLGFKEFKNKIYLEIKKNNNQQSKPVLIDSILATQNYLGSSNKIHQLSKLIITKKRILIQGFGLMRYEAKIFADLLRKEGIRANPIEFKEEIQGFKDYLLIILSTTWRSKITHEFYQYVQKHNQNHVISTITLNPNDVPDKIDAIVDGKNLEDSFLNSLIRKTIVSYIIYLILQEVKRIK